VELPVLVSRQLDLRSYGGVELVFAESPDLEMPVSDVLEALETAQTGCATVRYRLRDWNIARQRYWGPPVPIIYCTDCGAVPVPVMDLPVLLPLDINLNSHCNPLDQHPTFARTICPLCGAAARRDTDTLETYCSPWWYHWNAKRMSTADPFSQSEARLYMPVDVMIGGNDQARTCFFHLRMMARALKQAGVVELEEPIDTLMAIGMVKAEGRKMSKSEGNVIDPKDIIARHGADALRLAMMGAAAPDRDFSWSSDLVRRSYAFLTKVYRFSIRSADKLRLDTTGPSAVVDTNYSLSKKLATSVEKAVERTTLSMVQNMFHLAVSNLELLFAKIEGYESEALRRRSELDERDRGALAVSFGTFLKMLTPICPHIAEECWVLLHGSGLIAEAMWPMAFPDRFRKPAMPYTERP
jgi:leucyl-tRNA synthetase